MKKRITLILLICVVAISMILPLVACDKNVVIPINNPAYTYVDGSSVFIKMGTYPQKIADVAVATIKAEGTYNKDTDYYTYNQKQYKIISARPCHENMTATFSNGEVVEDNKEYAFEVQSIVWKIINKSLGEDTYYVYSKYILDTEIYQVQDRIYDAGENKYLLKDNKGNVMNDIYANNWEYSKLRETLKYFYTIAFDSNNKKGIIQTSNTNHHAKNSSRTYVTKDYVFCLTSADEQNPRYSFIEEDMQRRLRIVSDYAIARGAFYIEYDDIGKVGWAWTRSASNELSSFVGTKAADKVQNKGEITKQYFTDDTDYKVGYAPAMRVVKL